MRGMEKGYATRDFFFFFGGVRTWFIYCVRILFFVFMVLFIENFSSKIICGSFECTLTMEIGIDFV